MSRPRTTLTSDEALAALARCHVAPGADFHRLGHDQVELLLAEADRQHYRKPHNANGSRSRYFHDRLQRHAKPAKKTTVEPAVLARENAPPASILTLDELISAALLARAKSPLGGGTVVHLCEQDREYITCTRAVLDTDADHPEDGAVFLVCI